MTLIRRLQIALSAVLALVRFEATAAFAADSADANLVERGRYLATAGDCVACHTKAGGKPLAGGLPLETPFGAIVSTNITPSKTYGIGNYSQAQFADALRKGVRADGARLYPAMPYTSYAQVSDEDVKALYAYFMNAVAPVDAAAPQTHLPFPFNVRLIMAGWNLLFLDSKPFTPDASKSVEWNRGAYLVRGLTHCSTCHSPRNLLMAEKGSRDLGGADIGGWYAPNITSDMISGIGGWGEQEIIDYLRTGRAADKAQAAGPMGEAVDHSLRHLNDDDLRAIAVYVKTVAALHDDADTRPAFAWGAAADGVSGIRGIELAEDPNQMSGPQLYDAYCATCHGSSGEGADNGVLPSLFHNTALGSTNTNDLVMAVLEGVDPPRDTPDLLMPSFARELSDQQIATLGGYLVHRYGNPKAQVTAQQVNGLRSGSTPSWLLVAARVVIAAIAVVVLIGGAFFIIRQWRRKAV